ncbi:cell division protein ZipA C-terminal FtsZ-binding domain-containing protein [Psychrobacter sp.]|uniref:cell division protein ZipA C-terminal FtsZ-binding domain-containing protein n=1 Tax=Psychrobacter sp. TaxID=56811 RepID=UPI002649B194|nr:cell division protein ZipA C-terminal FtsZ-binding domain-containing protein [Psychrobacter sp.]MDN6274898.1 cell division protein [Psychrobacter sp.]MDN6306968.1 cell division protein [Psychrobacter sp.]
MTAIQFILIAIAAFIVLAGLFMVIRGLKRRNGASMTEVNYDKNGIPIIPRHERDIVEQPEATETVAGETSIGPDRENLSAVMENDKLPRTDADANIAKDEDVADHDIGSHKTDTNYAGWQVDQQRSDDVKFAENSEQMHIEQEPDAFSSLVSATDGLMPPIDIAQEQGFDDNSPILDQHLSAPVDANQNSPLINAKDNLNLTILPHQYQDGAASVIRGRDLLALVDKYGLRYGEMNMFHRYEEKDGTGILWFSMMGITDSGIAPFDPHTVATNNYNGLVVFLSLPHPKAVRGFDGMMSIAYMMASDLDAIILDEENQPITHEYKQQLRIQVRDYEA